MFDNNGGVAWHAMSTRNVIGVAAVIGEVEAYGDATAALMRCAWAQRGQNNNLINIIIVIIIL